MTTWFQRDPERLSVETDLMETRTRAVLRKSGNELLWMEQLVAKSGTRYDIIVTYPDTFPFMAPRGYVVRPNVDGAPHRLVGGSLCLFPNPVLADAPRTTAFVVRNRTILWFHAYEVWRTTGVWKTMEHH